jgi:hypothetical protein
LPKLVIYDEELEASKLFVLLTNKKI